MLRLVTAADATQDTRRLLEKIDDTLQGIRREFHDRTVLLAAEVRATLVMPLCQKYGLEFFHGPEATPIFRKGDVLMYSEGDARRHGYDELALVFRALSQPVGGSTCAGHQTLLGTLVRNSFRAQDV